jgi:hypothetical protein
VKGQLLADIVLFAMAQDIVQSARSNVKRTVQVLRLGRVYGELLIEPRHEARQELVTGVDVGDVCETQLLD